MNNKTAIVVPWHNPEQVKRWRIEWGIDNHLPAFVILQQDTAGEGCARTKNKGVREAISRGADVVVVLDDDCFPAEGGPQYLGDLAAAHIKALEPVPMALFKPVTNPPSRGTPYELPGTMPVAASMGFWTEVGDYDACAQLVRGARTPMTFDQDPIYGRYFPLCGMNIAFRPNDWVIEDGHPAGARYWWEFINVPRFDDIWMGWLWQREAYRRGYCFNLNGPIVRHSRQSNVWQNLRDEAKYLERNETLWRDIATHPQGDYESLRKLLPV